MSKTRKVAHDPFSRCAYPQLRLNVDSSLISSLHTEYAEHVSILSV